MLGVAALAHKEDDAAKHLLWLADRRHNEERMAALLDSDPDALVRTEVCAWCAQHTDAAVLLISVVCLQIPLHGAWAETWMSCVRTYGPSLLHTPVLLTDCRELGALCEGYRPVAAQEPTAGKALRLSAAELSGLQFSAYSWSPVSHPQS